MPCTKQGHSGGENCVTCIQHQTFKELGERRRARGIKLGKFQVNCDSAASGSMNDFFSGWIEVLGKEKATDLLLVAMRNADEKLRASMNDQLRKKVTPVKFTRVSAPRVED